MSRATLIAVIGSVVRTLTAGAAYGRRRMAVSRARVGVAAGLVLVLSAPALAQSGQVVEYYHLDALGSVRVVTDQAGQVIARHDFLPFGEEWPAPQPTTKEKKLFTGHERDAETGLDYFGARYYRPQVGRFTTIDPVYTWSENLTDPQRWNRYAYVRNNPLQWVDPDGRNPALPFICVIPGPQQPILIVGSILVTAAVVVSTEEGRRGVAEAASGLWNLVTKAVTGVRTWVSNEDSDAKAKTGSSQAPPTAPNTKDFENPDSIPKGWEWRGKGQPGSRDGAYHNPGTGESVHDDRTHPPGKPSHWTYIDPKGGRWENLGNGWIRQQ